VEDSVIWLLIVIGIFIIVALSTFIASKLRTLRLNDDVIRKKEQEDAANKLGLKQSLIVLCGSMLDKQVELSEGCMRVKVLLDHYDARLHHDQVLKVFNEVYNRLADMPRFEARKELDKQTIFELDKERFVVEQEFEARVLTASRELIEKIS